MKAEILKRIRIERYLFGIIMAFVMVFVAETAHEAEIIFPEICALTIGAWVSEQQPWMTNKRRIFILMSTAALFGVIVVKFFTTALIFQVCLCFAFTGFILTLFKTNFVPIISACILPVYLQTKSWIYPISVSLMSFIIILTQWLMEKYHFRPVNNFVPCEFNIKTQVIKWSKLLMVFGIIALIPFKTHQIYFLAPPLIVMFTELANPKSPARKKTHYIVGLMTFASAVGCILRLLLNELCGLPLYFCTALACIILFYAIDKLKIYFPPAGAILLIPMILDKYLLIKFPLEVFIGAVILSFCAITLFKQVYK
ncbi:HPP family protein [Candidatus Ruminimicrobiellum ovillum]|uniref:HPP family protein n=1 Tax=Candidatus Ruminimicrobiellum ovillum TaxID=1947927 RepID=UPI00355A6FD1